VSQTYFFDTSALVKLYHYEAGTERVEEVFTQPDSPMVISELATVELHAALARRVRMGEITVQAQDEALRNFEDDCAHRFVIDPFGSPVMQRARELLQRYGSTRALRTLDALQLGACLTVQSRGEVVFVCADTPLGEIGKLEGLTVFNPEMQQESAAEPSSESVGPPEDQSAEGREGSTGDGYAEF
jgi:predicted nucleic acid-binding protein